MLQKIKDLASSTLRPVAKRVLTPVLRSQVGEGLGPVHVARRFARQWAASAGLYEEEKSSEPPTATPGSAATASTAATRPTDRGAQRPVLLYVSSRHSSCKTAKRILDELGVEYGEVDLSDDPEGRQKLYRETQDRTFPQIYVGGKRLGGFDDLVVAREEGRLWDLLYPTAGNA